MEVVIDQIFGHAIRTEDALPSFRLNSASVYRYSLPLTHTLDTRSGQLKRRDGLILILNKDEEHIGIGEISPLPGFSEESLPLALSSTVQILQKLIGSNDDLEQFLRRGGDWNEMGLPSIANFGLETALLSLIAGSRGLHLGSLLFGAASSKVPVNGLINAELADWVPHAQALVEAGHRTLKIKVGSINSELEVLGIQSIREAVGPEIKIRLDANRSWNIEEAVKFGKALQATDIEYIEEPLRHAKDLPIFFNECGMHFAFDETLHHIIDPGISFQTYTGLKALVIKPSLVACMPRILHLIKQATEKGLAAVISSSYESDIGLANLAQFAAGVSGENIAVGLNTHQIFSQRLSLLDTSAKSGWLQVYSFEQKDLNLNSCELVFEKHA